MLLTIKKVLKYLVLYNIYVSIAAVCLSLETLALIDMPVRFDASCWFIFFSTVFVYNISRLRLFIEDHNLLQLAINQPVYFYTSLFALLGTFASVLFLDFHLSWVIIPLGLISLGYSMPFFKKRDYFHLRQIPGLKIFLIASVWGVATVVIPVMHNKLSIDFEVVILIIRRMLFVFAITIPFDIRDRVEDISNNIKTIPVLVGEKYAKTIAIVALALFSVLLFADINHKGYSAWLNGSVPLFISAVVAAFFVLKSPVSNRYFYLVILDGTMILQFLLVWIWN